MNFKKSLNQGFQNGGDFSKLGAKMSKGAKGGGQFKIFCDDLVLDILELQMKRKKNLRGFISNLETYLDYFKKL